MEQRFSHISGYVCFCWLVFNFGICVCNRLQPSQPKTRTSALVEDINGSSTQDDIHFRKSVYAGASPKIDTAHSPITPSDIKDPRDGQHRTHRQAHSENQVSPPLVRARLDTRSLLIGVERSKLASANRQWHPRDWVGSLHQVRTFKERGASKTRKSFLSQLTSAPAAKFENSAAVNGFLVGNDSTPPHSIMTKSKKSGLYQSRRGNGRSRWDNAANLITFRLQSLARMRSRNSINQVPLKVEGHVEEREFKDGITDLKGKSTPLNLSLQAITPSDSPRLVSSTASVSSREKSKDFSDQTTAHLAGDNTGVSSELGNIQNKPLVESHQNDVKDNRHHNGLTYDKVQSERPQVHDSGGNDAPRNIDITGQRHTERPDTNSSNVHIEQGNNKHDTESRLRRAATPHADPSVSQSSRARKEGDAIIGALFPLHYPPTLKTAYSRQCSKIREYYGIQRVEVFLMTIERINR